MDNSVLVFLIVDLTLLAVIILLKTILWVKASRRRSFGSWFYFTKYDIMNASNQASKKLKRRQNAWTVVLLVYFIASLISGYFVYVATTI
ncbi:MAG TPA: hypothetical protein VHB48_17780 [Chitinophagaceae bacterium]|nr:hypothetical protein [Chitinophagaceae bacterium]